jgi:MFS transporter, MHS family, alpha-ketoglutarate permease
MLTHRKVGNTTRTTATVARGEQLDLADVSRRVRAIFIGSVGNLVEWYDFYTYSAFAL